MQTDKSKNAAEEVFLGALFIIFLLAAFYIYLFLGAGYVLHWIAQATRSNTVAGILMSLYYTPLIFTVGVTAYELGKEAK